LPIFDSIKLYGKEKARLRKSGIMISDFDLFIGCTAVQKSLIMVTENIREFERISNIKIENWVKR
jgi:tRNA(fMet)-specific endonuclease VapC